MWTVAVTACRGGGFGLCFTQAIQYFRVHTGTVRGILLRMTAIARVEIEERTCVLVDLLWVGVHGGDICQLNVDVAISTIQSRVCATMKARRIDVPRLIGD